MSTVACYGFSRMLSSTGTTFSSISSLYPGQQQRCSFRTSRPWLRMQRFSYVQRDQSLRAGPSNQARDKNERPSGRSKLRRLRARARLLNFMLKKQLAQVTFANLVKFFQRNWRPVMVGGFLAFLFVISSVFVRLSAAYAPKSVPYSALIRSLEAQRVRSVLFEEGSSQIFFNMFAEPASQEKQGTPSVKIDDKEPVSSQKFGKTGVSRAQPAWQYCTRKIRHDESYLLGLLRSEAGKVEYSSAPRSLGSVAATVIGTILTLWIPMSPLLWLMHRQISGRGDVLRKRKKTLHAVKFEDVAGVDTAKAELWEIVSCLKGHSNFQSLGAKFPKGVLLIGPPGTGKTLLARALAGEAGVPFFAASASEFVEMFVGRGAARIRELFAMARKYAPSVIFIDELDAVGGQRGRGFNDERDQTLNQLLTEMDGFESETGVLVLAATNRAEALDPALCRAGRFSRKVYVKEPDLEGRKQVLAVHMRGVKVENDPELIQQFIASITPGFVGADLANLVNEAALLAARRGQTVVTLEDFKEAVYRSKYGVGQEPSLLSSLEKKMCAFLQNAGVTNKVDGYPATM